MFIISKKSEDANFLYKNGQELEMLASFTLKCHFWYDLLNSILLSVRSIVWTYYNPDEMFQRPRAQSSQEMSSPRTEENGGKRKVHDIVFYIATLDIFCNVIPLWLANNCWEVNTWSISSWSLGFPLPFYSLEEPALPYFSNQKLRKQASSERKKFNPIWLSWLNKCIIGQSVSPAIFQICPSLLGSP